MTLTLSDSEAELVKIALRVYKSDLEHAAVMVEQVTKQPTSASRESANDISVILTRLETQEQETK